MATGVPDILQLTEHKNLAELVWKVTEQYNMELLKKFGTLERDKSRLQVDIDELQKKIEYLRG